MTKGKITKKLVALATTIVMLTAMVIPAVAAPDLDEGKITVHKYSGSSLVNATANNTGEALLSTDTEHPLNNGYVALENAEFTLYMLAQADINAVNAAVTATNKVEGHSIAIVGGVPVVTFTMTDSTVFTATGAYVDDQITDGTGLAEFGTGTPLPDGYYVLVETDTPAGFLTTAPSLIRMPLTDSNGDRNYDIHVYPKNVSNSNVAVKDVDGLSKPVTTGDSVTFSLKAAFTSATVASAEDLKDGTNYGTASIKETFSNQFQYTAGSLKVYWLNAAGQIDMGAELAPGDWTNTALPTTAGGDFTVSLLPQGIDAAIAGTKTGFGIVLNAQYVGVPSADAGDTPDGIKNTMTAIVTAPGGIDEEVEDEIFVPSISVLVDKTTSVATGSNPLPGVTFAILTQAVAGLNYDPANTYTEAQLLAAGYILAPDSTPANGRALIATTDAAGQIVFSNLNGYVNTSGAEFWLKELVTVAGYQLKDNTIKVTFNTLSGYKAINSGWFDSADNWVTDVQINEGVTIENYLLSEEDKDGPGFSLPLTGGAGTILFTAVGIIVMLGAAVIYLHGKKRNA